MENVGALVFLVGLPLQMSERSFYKRPAYAPVKRQYKNCRPRFFQGLLQGALKNGKPALLFEGQISGQGRCLRQSAPFVWGETSVGGAEKNAFQRLPQG